MDYGYFEHYNDNVHAAADIFYKINEWLFKLPPYNTTFQYSVTTLEDILNRHSIIFYDGIGEPDGSRITWDTITETGYGEQLDDGCFRIHLTKFLRSPEDFNDCNADMQDTLLELNRSIEKFFNDYISFLNSYIAVHKVFKPFITQYLHSGNGFPQENDIAKLFEKSGREQSLSFDSIKCVMHSFGYKVLTDQNNKPILCEKISFADFQSFLYYDFFNGVKHNYIPNQCKQCGKFFLIHAGKYYSYCDRPLKDEPSKTCRDIGAKKRYDDKCKTDPVWRTYNRAYKAHYARYMKKKMTVAEFEQWSLFASEIRDKAIAEQIPYEQYYTDIRK